MTQGNLHYGSTTRPTKKMATRASNKHKNEEPLKIVRHLKTDKTDSQDDVNKEIVAKMNAFALKTIDVPQELRSGQKPITEVAASAINSDGVMTMDGTEEKPSPLEQAMRIGQELYGYGHCKIQDENQVFKYTRRCLDRLAIERNQVVPSHYIKHAETVLGENQNTVEKNWSYYTPLYEITDEMQGKLRDAKVDMHLDDAALVIDCWEKVAVNDLVVENKVLPLRDNKAHCISRFRAIHSKRMRGDDLDDRVTEAACARLWEVWLETRESRKHRSLIRMFWVYHDEVGGDNYKTFQRPKIDVKPHNTRKKCKPDEKIKTYGNKFIERDNAVTFCETLQPAFEKLVYQVEAYKMEDLQFDLMIGKVTSEEAQKSLQEMANPAEPLQMIIRVAHKNQSSDAEGHLKRYFHDGLKRPVPSKPKPLQPTKTIKEQHVTSAITQKEQEHVQLKNQQKGQGRFGRNKDKNKADVVPMQPNDAAEDHHEAQKKPALDDLPDVPFNPNKIDENAKESVRR